MLLAAVTTTTTLPAAAVHGTKGGSGVDMATLVGFTGAVVYLVEFSVRIILFLRRRPGTAPERRILRSPRVRVVTGFFVTVALLFVSGLGAKIAFAGLLGVVVLGGEFYAWRKEHESKVSQSRLDVAVPEPAQAIFSAHNATVETLTAPPKQPPPFVSSPTPDVNEEDPALVDPALLNQWPSAHELTNQGFLLTLQRPPEIDYETYLKKCVVRYHPPARHVDSVQGATVVGAGLVIPTVIESEPEGFLPYAIPSEASTTGSWEIEFPATFPNAIDLLPIKQGSYSYIWLADLYPDRQRNTRIVAQGRVYWKG